MWARGGILGLGLLGYLTFGIGLLGLLYAPLTVGLFAIGAVLSARDAVAGLRRARERFAALPWGRKPASSSPS